ncbi:homeobox protein Hmx-like [Musca vetustissima]|uniref:homeobox protein Hmx-like n=1 Tax=Musca vetustissima TaxID=27455 RepID=UPI002AB6AA26|nr:homeobox protein Hmx-like [Musca vetustissima]
MAAEVTAATSLKQTEMDVNHQKRHINKASIAAGSIKRLARHIAQGQQHHGQQQEQHQQLQHQHQIHSDSDTAQQSTDDGSNSIKRSYSSLAASAAGGSSGLASTLNSLSSLSALQHIRSSSGIGGGVGYGYDTTAAAHIKTQQPSAYTEAKPIYEDQQEHEYAATSGPSHQLQQHQYGLGGNAALHSAIYNLQAAGTHNAGLGATSVSANNGGSNGFRPSWNFGKLSTSFSASTVASTPYNSYHPYAGAKGGSGGGGIEGGISLDSSISSSNEDKISEGNFLHHYDSASGYNELTQQTHQTYQPHYETPHYAQQQQQLHQPQQYQQHYHRQHQADDYNYNSVEQAAESSSSYGEDIQQAHDHSNYLPPTPPSGAGEHHEEKQPDVINYVPYPVVKKLHVPVHEPVQIPVSHAVIIPIKKPVPIHVPITQNVQIPVEKDLKIPVERVVPYPVEKHVPVPVEKPVPYEVIKYVPIKVARPFPVKVPVFKTVLHKVKGWW